MEITLSTAISFLFGITIGSIVMNVYWNKKIQKTKGNNSPNIMGDKNSIKL